MPWKKGQSGNPLGRLPGEKQFADQLRMGIHWSLGLQSNAVEKRTIRQPARP